MLELGQIERFIIFIQCLLLHIFQCGPFKFDAACWFQVCIKIHKLSWQIWVK